MSSATDTRTREPTGRADEVVFLAMELLHGETLADKLQRDGRFSTAELLPVVRQMAAGLTAAHRVGVVHRDFKSQNVMLVKPTREEEEMRVVVTDFGLAWRSTHDESTVSVAGDVCGARDRGHSGVHGPRAGRGRPCDARNRRLRAWRRALRDGDRGLALRGGHPDQDGDQTPA